MSAKYLEKDPQKLETVKKLIFPVVSSAIIASANICSLNEIDAFVSHDLMALPFMPVTLDPLRTHNFLQIV
jgi:hypothetical protein